MLKKDDCNSECRDVQKALLFPFSPGVLTFSQCAFRHSGSSERGILVLQWRSSLLVSLELELMAYFCGKHRIGFRIDLNSFFSG